MQPRRNAGSRDGTLGRERRPVLPVGRSRRHRPAQRDERAYFPVPGWCTSRHVPHRAERRAGQGTPTSGQFSRWGPAPLRAAQRTVSSLSRRDDAARRGSRREWDHPRIGGSSLPPASGVLCRPEVGVPVPVRRHADRSSATVRLFHERRGAQEDTIMGVSPGGGRHPRPEDRGTRRPDLPEARKSVRNRGGPIQLEHVGTRAPQAPLKFAPGAWTPLKSTLPDANSRLPRRVPCSKNSASPDASCSLSPHSR